MKSKKIAHKGLTPQEIELLKRAIYRRYNLTNYQAETQRILWDIVFFLVSFLAGFICYGFLEVLK